ncbi:uncharacterized protein LOC110974429 [Acanthaster planci]|uniref:Uncharacterized protein LOC110974429 n=1 Tax=Acanthaster planci TaxID=133434 RepID=A0A8B7XP18_ACAPL|nr:uncharacterized protein LOC110974429 [Acanthaster planci]
MMHFFEVLCIFLAVVSITYACSVSDDWKSESIENRARKPKWVVYGTVASDHMPMPGSNLQIDQHYWVVVKPLCWLRGNPQPEDSMQSNTTVFENITVSEDAPCVSSDLVKGKRYILFLGKGFGTNFSVYDVNVQPGALEDPSEETFEAVHRGIDAGLKEGYPDGKCLDGVDVPCFTGVPDPEVCNQGMSIGIGLWCLILAVMWAISVY